MEFRARRARRAVPEGKEMAEFRNGRSTLGWNWVEYEPDGYEQEAMPAKGELVRMRWGNEAASAARGVPPGTVGRVVGHGRSELASVVFTSAQEEAEKAGRELTYEDYDVLDGADGPVVEFRNGVTDWFPGQAMSLLEKYEPSLQLTVKVNVAEEVELPQVLQAIGLRVEAGERKGFVRDGNGNRAGEFEVNELPE